MDEIRTTGKTVDDALTEALIQLGTTSDQVEYDVIEKGSAGILGFGRKLAVIEVRRKKQPKPAPAESPVFEAKPAKPARPEKKEASYETREAKPEKKAVSYEAKAERSEKKAAAYETKKEEKSEKANIAEEIPVSGQTDAKPAKPVTPLDGEKTKEQIQTFLTSVFQTMKMDVEIKYQIDEAARTVAIELVGSDMGVLIGKRGQTLDSLQYLISLVVNKDTNEYIRIKLDTENYRKRRRATLENLAKNIAYKVKRERKPITLEPMNPYERRIIHSTLQNDRYVETHSEGAEPYRRVVVSLKK